MSVVLLWPLVMLAEDLETGEVARNESIFVRFTALEVVDALDGLVDAVGIVDLVGFVGIIGSM
jgi:hypothetical protein